MNQKVIEEDFRGLFSSRGILVFERLGLQGIQRVTKLAKIRKIVQNLGQKFTTGLKWPKWQYIDQSGRTDSHLTVFHADASHRRQQMLNVDIKLEPNLVVVGHTAGSSFCSGV